MPTAEAPRQRPGAARAVAVLGVAALATALTFRYLLGHRTDYVGHYLAGLGGTLLLLAPLAARRKPSGWPVVALVAVAIGIGYVTESTVFRIAIFDPVDFVNQSLGACVAGAGVMGRPGSARRGATIAVLGLVCLWAGVLYAFA